jgi:hypothetical protein
MRKITYKLIGLTIVIVILWFLIFYERAKGSAVRYLQIVQFMTKKVFKELIKKYMIFIHQRLEKFCLIRKNMRDLTIHQ